MNRKPRMAATVILLRPAGPRGFEVFLTRRAEGMAFLGGMYCFPGGALRQEDFSEAMLRRAAGVTPSQAQKFIGAEYSPRQALGLCIAAIRELYEEAGILLALNGAGEPILANTGLGRRLSENHSCLLGKALSFHAVLESEGLFCDLAALAHFSHWQTPAHEFARFDTHFFLAPLPADQSTRPTSSEITRSVWLTPDEALRLCGKNELPMIFPTFASLRTLADFDSFERVFKEYRAPK
ncbi:MAG TPA: NUDIX hydrolase [Candidatus Binatia bacterium]|jgi:8-oxo-dGTP pyrophosphatase MutT (NUDIX family)